MSDVVAKLFVNSDMLDFKNIFSEVMVLLGWCGGATGMALDLR